MADYFGFDDPESPLFARARAAWPRWCADEPTLDVVDDLCDLRDWTRRVGHRVKDEVMVTLVALARDDEVAAVAVAWLLMPGATRLADRLRDLDPEIDALVAGELWLEVREAHRFKPRWIARTILNEVARAVQAELGIGDAGRRKDRAWSMSACLEQFGENDTRMEPVRRDSREELMDLLSTAFCDHAIEGRDMWLLYELAVEANRRGAPMHRGRFGLTSPAVVDAVCGDRSESERTVRRRASKALDALAAYVTAVLDDQRFAVWRAGHPERLPSAKELLADEFYVPEGVTARDRASAAGSAAVQSGPAAPPAASA